MSHRLISSVGYVRLVPAVFSVILFYVCMYFKQLTSVDLFAKLTRWPSLKRLGHECLCRVESPWVSIYYYTVVPVTRVALLNQFPLLSLVFFNDYLIQVAAGITMNRQRAAGRDRVVMFGVTL